MIISKSRRFIFVHVPKNAGSSITAHLLPFATSNIEKRMLAFGQTRRYFGAYLDPRRYPTHIKAHELVAAMGAQCFDSYFSFGIVRNPWDRLVSLYSFIVKKETHRRHQQIKAIGSFERFVTLLNPEQLTYQRDFLFDANGRQLVSFIGRYERLSEDFAQICRRIAIAQQPLPSRNVSNNVPYQDFYNDHTRELVRRIYAPDIETFGYEF